MLCICVILHQLLCSRPTADPISHSQLNKTLSVVWVCEQDIVWKCHISCKYHVSSCENAMCCHVEIIISTRNCDILYTKYCMFPHMSTRAETNTRFARVFARLHKYSNTKRGIRIHIYIDFLHYFLHFL